MRQQSIGPHVLEFIDEDVLAFRQRGLVVAVEAAELVQLMHLRQPEHPGTTLLVDYTQSSSVEAAARKLIIDGAKQQPYPVVFLGTSFPMRVLMMLMLNAARLGGVTYPFHFAKTEDEAQTWARREASLWAQRSAHTSKTA